MARLIRELSSKTSEAISSLYVISDFRCALEAVVLNALEANANSILVNCHLPSSTFTVSDNGCGFSLTTMLKIGNGPWTTKQNPSNRGIGLFSLGRVAKLSITSISPLTGLYKEKVISFDGTMDVNDAKALDGGYTTRVTVTELFGNCPVRQRFLEGSLASQQASIVQFMTQIAAAHHTVHFSLSMNGVQTLTLAAEDVFGRLSSLFSDSFTRAVDWIPIDFISQKLHLNGFVVSPHANHCVSSRSNAARLLFCRARVISSPELTSTIDSIWLSYYVSKLEEKHKKRYPIFFLEVGGPQDEIQLFRGVDVSTLVLYHTGLSSSLKNLRIYLNHTFSQLSTRTATEDEKQCLTLAASSSGSSDPSTSSVEPIGEESDASTLSVVDIWEGRPRANPLQRRAGLEIPACRLPRNSFPDPQSLAKMRVIGQVNSNFILCLSRANVLCAFDQHAVHERLRFEFLLQLLRSKSSDCLDFSLLSPPRHIPVSFIQYNNLYTFEKELNSWNWQFELKVDLNGRPMSPTLVVLKVPSISKKTMSPEQVLLHTAELVANRGSSLIPSIFLTVIKSKACRGAIMFGDVLAQVEMESMIRGLSKCAQPFACAHGRTSIALLTDI